MAIPPSAFSVSNVAFAQQPVVEVLDAFGNRVTTDNATVVTVALTGGSGVLQGVRSATASSGLASFAGNTLRIDLVSADKVLTFPAPGLTSTATGAFAITAGAPDAATSTTRAAPDSITADSASQSTVTVQTRDAAGSALVTGGATVLMSIYLGSLGAVIDNVNGAYSATLTAGLVAGTATVSGKRDVHRRPASTAASAPGRRGRAHGDHATEHHSDHFGRGGGV